MKARTVYIIAAILFIAGFIYNLGVLPYFQHDLRNRITGARLMKANNSPYFYHWNAVDGEKFFDPSDYGEHPVTRTTATPFVLRSLGLIADQPQKNIQPAWFCFEYLLLILSWWVLFRMKKDEDYRQKLTLLFSLSTLCFTWFCHLFSGQLYIVHVALLSMIYYFLQKENRLIRNDVAAAFLFVVLLLTRPNMILIGLPFLFIATHYKRFIIASAVFLSIYIFWVLLSNEHYFWKEYFQSASMWAEIWQNNPPASLQTYNHYPGPIEGIPLQIIPQIKRAQLSNIPLLWKIAVGHKLPDTVCYLLLALSAIFLIWISYKKLLQPLQLPGLFIAGFLIYSASEFFLPVARANYNGLQWLFPVAVMLPALTSKDKWIYFLLIAGFIFSLPLQSFIKMNTLIGEVFIAAALLYFLLRKEPAQRLS